MPTLRTPAIDRLTRRRAANKVYDQSVWMLRAKCEVGRICELPLMDENFARAFDAEIRDAAFQTADW